jgi:hypothetical protein
LGRMLRPHARRGPELASEMHRRSHNSGGVQLVGARHPGSLRDPVVRATAAPIGRQRSGRKVGMLLRLADVPALAGGCGVSSRAKVARTCLRGLRPRGFTDVRSAYRRRMTGIDPQPRVTTVYARQDCVRWGGRGPFHWTAECIEGRGLVGLEVRQAEAMSTCGRASCARLATDGAASPEIMFAATPRRAGRDRTATGRRRLSPFTRRERFDCSRRDRSGPCCQHRSRVRA